MLRVGCSGFAGSGPGGACQRTAVKVALLCFVLCPVFRPRAGAWCRGFGPSQQRHHALGRRRCLSERTAAASAALCGRDLSWERLLARGEELVERLFDHPDLADELRAVQAELGRLAREDAEIAGCGGSGEADAAAARARRRVELDAASAAVSRNEALFQEVRRAKLRGGPMPEADFDQLADGMNKRFRYRPTREAFRPTRYRSFDDWFLRRLADDTRDACLQKAAAAEVCCPVQGKVWPHVLSGELTLKVSVIAAEDLLGLMDGGRLVQIRLRWMDYHRVHSPVDGTVSRVDACLKDELFPGSEAMTIFTIEAAFGRVKLMCIGEWSVQSFVTDVDVGHRVKKMDELGYFDFGSQIILVLPDDIDMVLNGGEKVFPGDPIAVQRGTQDPQVGEADVG